MLRLFSCVLLLLLLIPKSTSDVFKFRAITFNTLKCGENNRDGIKHVVGAIKRLNPDIVALQEISNSACLNAIVQGLGPKWYGISRRDNYPDSGIISKWPIAFDSISEYRYGIGATVQLPIWNKSIKIAVFSVHFQWRNYGPYAACKKLVTSTYQLKAGEILPRNSSRLRNTHDFMNLDLYKKINWKMPILLMGDFNTPSHLDWTPQMALKHCNWTYPWPVTKRVMQMLQFKDSFREVHPDVNRNRGNTWSPIYKRYHDPWGDWGNTIPEPQDRIDYIFYKGNQLRATESFVYMGNTKLKPMPFHLNNTYPSDHAIVVTDFELDY